MTAVADAHYKHIKLITGGKISPIDQNVFLGCCFAARDEKKIKGYGITYVLKMYNDDPRNGSYRYHRGIKYKVIDADDVPTHRIANHFDECIKFVQQALKEDARILIHCHAGISRSATIVLTHLMINRGMTLKTAYDYLRIKRSIVKPNPGFWKDLQILDKKIKQLRATNKTINQKGTYPFSLP